MRFFTGIIALFLLVQIVACGSSAEKLPPAPSGADAVKSLIKEKKFTVHKTGFYSGIAINDKKEINWIDIATEKEALTKKTAEELKQFSVQFLNDTAVVITSHSDKFEGTYVVDDIVDEFDKGQEGVKIRLTYIDPKMTFGASSTPVKMTYTYHVKGAGDKQLLLQLPRDINRQPLIALLTE